MTPAELEIQKRRDWAASVRGSLPVSRPSRGKRSPHQSTVRLTEGNDRVRPEDSGGTAAVLAVHTRAPRLATDTAARPDARLKAQARVVAAAKATLAQARKSGDRRALMDAEDRLFEAQSRLASLRARVKALRSAARFHAKNGTATLAGAAGLPTVEAKLQRICQDAAEATRGKSRRQRLEDLCSLLEVEAAAERAHVRQVLGTRPDRKRKPRTVTVYEVRGKVRGFRIRGRMPRSDLRDLLEAGFTGTATELRRRSVRPLLEGFTGTLTDKLGRKIHYVDGKRVKGAVPAAGAAGGSTRPGAIGVDRGRSKGKGEGRKPAGREGSSRLPDIKAPQNLKGDAALVVRHAEAVLGRKVEPGTLGALALAPDGAWVRSRHLSYPDRQVLELTMSTDEGYTSVIEVHHHKDGEIHCELTGIRTLPVSEHHGKLFPILVNGLAAAKQLGATRISGTAQRMDSDDGGEVLRNGYAFWPKMGFDGRLTASHLSRLPKDVVDRLKATRPKPTGLLDRLRDMAGYSEPFTVQDLYAVEDGRKAWKEHGSDIRGGFDLADDSRSMQVLGRFLKRLNRGTRDRSEE